MSSKDRWSVIDAFAKALILGLVLSMGLLAWGCGGDEPVAPLAPASVPEYTCEAARIEHSQGLTPPEPGWLLFSWVDHQEVYFLASVVDRDGNTLDSRCAWDKAIRWTDRGTGDADCQRYGNALGARTMYYCFGIGNVGISSSATKDGKDISGESRHFVRASK